MVKSINDVFAHDEVRLMHIGLVLEQTRGNQVCLVDRATLITPAHRAQHLVAQPREVCLKLCQHGGGGENSRERLVAMQQIPGILLHSGLNRVDQRMEIGLVEEIGTEIKNDEIAD